MNSFNILTYRSDAITPLGEIADGQVIIFKLITRCLGPPSRSLLEHVIPLDGADVVPAGRDRF
jgi:hypothetical protein